MWYTTTLAGNKAIGVYDHPAPEVTGMSSKELDPDAWPVPTSGLVFRSIFRAAAWFTEMSDQLDELVLNG